MARSRRERVKVSLISGGGGGGGGGGMACVLEGPTEAEENDSDNSIPIKWGRLLLLLLLFGLFLRGGQIAAARMYTHRRGGTAAES